MMNRRLTLPFVVILLHTIGGCAHEAKQPPPQRTDADIRQLQKVAEAAHKALDFVVWERDQGQRPLTPQLIEELHVWSHRFAAAKVALASTRDERISIAGAYLHEMKKLDGEDACTVNTGMTWG
jgi:hypothetical protein